MRDDLVVPGENEEKFVVATDSRVVTIPFTPLEERMSKEKPYLMEGLAKLHDLLGPDKFKKYIYLVVYIILFRIICSITYHSL